MHFIDRNASRANVSLWLQWLLLFSFLARRSQPWLISSPSVTNSLLAHRPDSRRRGQGGQVLGQPLFAAISPRTNVSSPLPQPTLPFSAHVRLINEALTASAALEALVAMRDAGHEPTAFQVPDWKMIEGVIITLVHAPKFHIPFEVCNHACCLQPRRRLARWSAFVPRDVHRRCGSIPCLLCCGPRLLRGGCPPRRGPPHPCSNERGTVGGP